MEVIGKNMVSSMRDDYLLTQMGKTAKQLLTFPIRFCPPAMMTTMIVDGRPGKNDLQSVLWWRWVRAQFNTEG
jgi:hypothetical protein